jgi:DNA-binding transcriptional ArsR family regulator
MANATRPSQAHIATGAIAALADPTRRAIFERLRRGPQPVAALAHGLPVSRPAVSQHLKVLKDAGLVSDRADGARRIYRVDPDGLGAIRAWLDQFWDASLSSLQVALEYDAAEAAAAARPKKTNRKE